MCDCTGYLFTVPKIEDGVVHISLSNGKTGKVKLDLLSEEDQKYAKNQQAAKDASPFEIDESEPAKAVSSTKKSETVQSVKQATTVTVEGIGSTFEKAKVDAFRNAVSQVVGTLVDAETRVEQEKVLEQILTASNAYVDKHKILSQEQKGGLWHVKMEATVESRALQMRLGESTETTSKVDGSSLLGRIETKAASEDEPVLLLAKVLRDQNFPYSVMEATAEMVKDPVKKEGENFVMQLNVTVKGNAQKFDEFRKAIEPTLEKLALSKRTMNLKTGKKQWSSGEESYYIIDPPNSTIGQHDYDLYDNETTSIFVYLNTTRNSSALNTGWNGYELPNKNVFLFAAYSLIVPTVEISLNDSEGNVIVTERVACYVEKSSPYGYETYPYNCTNQLASHYGGGRTTGAGGYSVKTNMGSSCLVNQNGYFSINQNERQFIRSPLRIQNFCLAPFFYEAKYHNARFFSQGNFTVTVTLEPNELKSVKTIKCTALSQNPDMDEYYRKLPELLKNWQRPKKTQN